MANFNLDDYVPVNARIEKFYKEYPAGRIQTVLIKDDGKVVQVKAAVWRSDSDENAAATGHAEEVRGEGYVNKTSAIENCETSAVGRALALLGFEISKSIASREEVDNAQKSREASGPNVRANPAPITPPAPPPPQARPVEPAITGITADQRKKIFASLRDKGYTDIVSQRQLIKDITGSESTSDLSRDQASSLIDDIQSL